MAKEIKNTLINFIHDRELKKFVSIYFKCRLVDIGCGTKPYAAMLTPYVTEHIGVDHAGSLHSKDNVNLIGTAYKIPVPDQSFDSALCTAVLEHLEEPEEALRECYRVLKPGGVAI